MIKSAFRYLNYLLKAVDEHSLHAPFIYHFYTTLIKPDNISEVYLPFQQIRRNLSKDYRTIHTIDLGAGSLKNKSPEKKVSKVVRNSTTPSKHSRLFHRIIKSYQCDNMIELGTSLGINTLYMASGNKNGQVYTLEGCPQIAEMAQKVFDQFQDLNIQLILGNIDSTLPELVKKLNSIDFVYFDANHTFDATLNYFNTCLPGIHENSIFVFDDIHWSEDMEKAWETIKNHKKVTLSIDLFDSGIIIFKPLVTKQHYVLNY